MRQYFFIFGVKISQEYQLGRSARSAHLSCLSRTKTLASCKVSASPYVCIIIIETGRVGDGMVSALMSFLTKITKSSVVM